MEITSQKRDLPERITNRERKRLRKMVREKQLCIEYHKTGSCKYGDNCKYTHGERTKDTELLINSLMKEKCQSTLRDESHQRNLLKQKDELMERVSNYLGCVYLFPSSLRGYSHFFVMRTIENCCLDQYVLMNANGVCIIGLAASHSLIRYHHECHSIQWGTTKQHQQIECNTVSGKSKKGGTWLDEDDIVCVIQDETGCSYPVIAGVRGRLVEINERINENPLLISQKPSSLGFICIVQPKFNDIDYLLHKLTSLEMYCSSFF